jgi:putative hydrolase of the HAD superfamily
MKTFKKLSIKAIFFDLDDTLYDRSQFEINAYKFIDQKLWKKYDLKKGVIYKNLIKIKNLHNYNYRKLFEDTFEKIKVDPKKKNVFERNCLKYYREFVPSKLRLFPNTLNVLKKIKKENYFIGIITNGRIKKQKTKIKILNIEKYFNLIVYARNFGKKKEKPNPHSFNFISQKLKIKPDEIIYIGDNPKTDYVGAKNAKVNFLRIKLGEYRKAIILKKNINSVKNMKELSKLI